MVLPDGDARCSLVLSLLGSAGALARCRQQRDLPDCNADLWGCLVPVESRSSPPLLLLLLLLSSILAGVRNAFDMIVVFYLRIQTNLRSLSLSKSMILKIYDLFLKMYDLKIYYREGTT